MRELLSFAMKYETMWKVFASFAFVIICSTYGLNDKKKQQIWKANLQERFQFTMTRNLACHLHLNALEFKGLIWREAKLKNGEQQIKQHVKTKCRPLVQLKTQDFYRMPDFYRIRIHMPWNILETKISAFLTYVKLCSRVIHCLIL